jgi:D-alanyl-D-alanine carboxypeptidase
MKIRRLPLATLTFLQSACGAEAVTHGDPAAHARTQLARMVREQELPGAQYVAVTADRTLLDVQAGVTDVATGERMEHATLQMAYSVSKIVTAIAVLQLVDDGKIELDAPLSRYFSTHPYGERVTIRMLLAHTSGVPNPMPLTWFALEGERLDRDAALHELLAKHAKRNATPGETYGYSNIGYWLLEKAIESASGQDYARHVEQRVFAPLAVARGAIAFELAPHLALATGHARRFTFMNALLHVLTPRRYWAGPHRGWSRSARVRSLGRGYGGLFCSASALAAVLQDLLRAEPTLMSARARDQMFAVQRTNDGKPIEGTLGWVTGELDGVRYFGKQGGGLGFHGNVRVYPELGIATVLLANRTEVSPGPIDARSDAIDAGFAARPH